MTPLDPYKIIAAAVNEALRDTTPTRPVDVSSLKKRMAENKRVNYDRNAAVFAQAFWERNYWKAVYFFAFEYRARFAVEYLPHISILSIGAGSAADTVASMVWANEHVREGVRVSITLLDKSESQLKLAKHILASVLPRLSRIEWDIVYVREDATVFDFASVRPHIVLMSHVLTENQSVLHSMLTAAALSLSSGGDLIVIERERDAAWLKAVESLAELGLSVYDADIRAYTFDSLKEHVPVGSRNMTPHYVKTSAPLLPYQAALVRQYFRAWKEQSMDMLSDIFAKDAIYDEKPGIEPELHGLNAIREYWNSNPMRQSNIRISLRNSAHENGLVVCAFHGDFDTPKQHIAIRGAINFSIDAHQQKVRKVVEFFGTEKTPHGRPFALIRSN